MATDWAAHECLIHTFGPPNACVCERFYRSTFCNPPLFFNFDAADTQTESAWLFLNSHEWIEYKRQTPTRCRWQYSVNFVGDPNQLTLEYLDNPDFDPGVDNFRYLAKWTISYEPPVGLPSFFDLTLKFDAGTTGIPRSTSWLITESGWVGRFGNDPTVPAPKGTIQFDPELCQPDWEDDQLPR